MRYSHLFGKTIKSKPSDTQPISHFLLVRGGFIRESASGRYYFLPLGMRVQQKIVSTIKKYMDEAGAQEMLTPVLHPLSLWKETNRDQSTGFELTVVKDRRGSEFALGGTAEEMFVDLLRKFQISYKELPLNLYQFSSKFRDELRARGGLLRVREFLMKDAYSFHANQTDFEKEYKKMWDTYKKIFDALGLPTKVVESDNGYIGGDYCHEFIVESAGGESKFLESDNGRYSAHEDIAEFSKDIKNVDTQMAPLQPVEAKRGTTMEDGVKLHKLPLWQQIKDVLFVDEKDRFILALIRGDFDVNEVKLKNAADATSLRHATPGEIRDKLHSEPGFLSPVGIRDKLDPSTKLLIIADDSLRTIKNAYGGANHRYKDYLNINIGRDYKPDLESDIALAKSGFLSPDGKSKLADRRGIEVGNIFQLGYYYTKKMKNAVFTDQTGKRSPFYMGCYGIGVGRTQAAIVELHNDKQGIIWPKTVTPYQVHLIGLDLDRSTDTAKRADAVYRQLQDKDIEVLFDDRNTTSPGEKFQDADLIGIPIRLVVSKRTRDNIEWKERDQDKTQLLDLNQVVDQINKFYS